MTPRTKASGRRTVVSLLKSYYDEEIFALLIREFYSADRAVSLEAIESSASLGNEIAVPHLYRILEAGTLEQKIAAARGLAAIRAPSSVAHLVRYYSLFSEVPLKRELLAAANRIAAHEEAVQELDRNVLQTPGIDDGLAAEALAGLIDAGRADVARPHLASAPPAAQLAALRRLAELDGERSPGLLDAFRDRLEGLAPEVLGRTLAVLAVRDVPALHVQLVDRLRRAQPDVTRAFLTALTESPAPLPHPKHMFRLALVVPHVDFETEAVVGGLVERIVREATGSQSAPLSFFWFTASTLLDSVFARVRKDFLSIRGLKGRSSLLVVILAKLIERYASPSLLQRAQSHFQGSLRASAEDLARELEDAMAEAPEEDHNQRRAAESLFAARSPRLRILISSQLACVNLDRPNLIRRLNRLVRVAGLLRARAAAARVAEILEFARDERIGFLEETSVVTLCQLAHRRTLEGLRESLGEPDRAPATARAYIRGARWLAPRALLPIMVRLLSRPELSSSSRALALETLETWDLSREPAALGTLFGVLDRGTLADSEAQRLGEVVARNALPANAALLIDMSRSRDPVVKRAAARALRNIAGREDLAERDLLTNALYALLDSGRLDIEVPALLGLVREGDDYAQQVLAENLRRGDEAYLLALLPEIADEIVPEAVPEILALLSHRSPQVQERLREAIARIATGRLGEQIRAGLIRALKGADRPPAGTAPAAPPPLAVRAKSEYRFRRENVQVLTVLFADMVGYTERTEASDTTSLLGTIQAFEDVVLPQIDTYDGRLIKKMGDGVLAVFKHPLKAALAALALQGKIRSHNEFRVESEKLLVRVGLNTGLVVRKGGDVFGDVVNVAARMQASANPGEILLTHATYQEIRELVVCTPLGGIQVKGKKEPIMAYAATEVLGGAEGMIGSLGTGTERQLAELKLTETIVEPAYVFPSGAPVQDEMARILSSIFQDITRAGEELTRDYHEEGAFKSYLQEKWDELVHRIGRDGRNGRAAPL